MPRPPDIDALKLEIHLAEFQVAMQRAGLRALHGSLSWKVTAPLRWLQRGDAGRRGRTPAAMLGYLPARCAAVQALRRVALAERSHPARTLLACAAAGPLHAAHLLDGQQAGAVRDGAVAACRNADATLALAGVVLDQRGGRPEDMEMAVALYRHCLGQWSLRGWTIRDHVAFVDALDMLGATQAAAAHLQDSGLEKSSPLNHACLSANLAHPGRGGDTATWLAAVNRLFATDGLEPVVLDPGSVPAMDRLDCNVEAATEVQPLVSVIMPTFRPGPELDTAIASVLRQGWRNLELLVVDDGSPDADFARVQAWAERDPRVRALRLDRNLGTYAARNMGLAHARGEFVTCHDADDWSHPRKIEQQAGHLLRHSHCMANLSAWARTAPSLRFERFSMRGGLVYPNLSSLMFRRREVRAALGGWDCVRYAADSEFVQRLAKAFGHEPPLVAAAPMSFGRIRPDSLTGGSLGRGYISPERRLYESAWIRWHEVADRASLRMEPTDRRCFAAPAAMLAMPEMSGQAAVAPTRVLVADFYVAGDPAKALAAQVERALEEEGRVALCQLRAFHTSAAATARLALKVQDLINEGRTWLVPLEADLACDLAHVLEPRVLEFASRMRSGIRPKRLIIEWPSADAPRQAIPLDRGGCAAEARRLFGIPPQA